MELANAGPPEPTEEEALAMLGLALFLYIIAYLLGSSF
jgi:hypothetical protein